jgi:predicted ferric reductase
MVVNSDDAVFTGMYSIRGDSVIIAEKSMFDDKAQIAGIYTKSVDVSSAIKYEDYSSMSLMMWIVWIFIILVVIVIVVALGYGGYRMYQKKKQ